MSDSVCRACDLCSCHLSFVCLFVGELKVWLFVPLWCCWGFSVCLLLLCGIAAVGWCCCFLFSFLMSLALSLLQ